MPTCGGQWQHTFASISRIVWPLAPAYGHPQFRSHVAAAVYIFGVNVMSDWYLWCTESHILISLALLYYI